MERAAGRAFWAEGTAGAKALGQEEASGARERKQFHEIADRELGLRPERRTGSLEFL